MTPSNGRLVALVRQAIDAALQDGRPAPGRPTLVRLTGATDHAVRKALAEVAQCVSTRDQAGDTLMITSQPGDASPPADHHAGEPLANQPTSQSPITTSGGMGGDHDKHQSARLLAPVRQADQDLAARDIRLASATAGRQARPWPLIVIGLAAAVAVWGGWVELGRLTGFGMVQPLPGLWDDLHINTAIVLPLGIEAYGGYALRTWLSSAALAPRTRSFARWSAITSLLLGADAQVASHLMKAANMTTAPPLVTVLVACVPVLVLGLATGLATLVKHDANIGEKTA
jgi:hypothetical protein